MYNIRKSEAVQKLIIILSK